ncbi:unnamed protein product (macronuclear) [Paramecium tetraurelia]|uniref:Uncharacterized protein n=1 Tax=Paramecium tetraurelia TaxID=5888 RepID=A0DPX8_PARTE|nr:uncharacterized protein GSPATT00002494001 [Paramecium tetraurelia]CAK85095.1 unnamed protein product [Paramecium tetraurelia]|eukprot:XP_001452492.1 hypothetical protein (macronuclear) [Paramecium tetraurelia strain d4-2]
MQGARFVETNLVQKMLRNQSYDFHKKKLDQIQTEQLSYCQDLAKSQDLLSKICQYQVKHNNQKHNPLDFRNLNKESGLMNKINIQLHISQKFKKAKHLNSDQYGQYKIQERKHMQVELFSFKADTSLWSENALGKRLHSPLRRKQQQKIDEENYELQKRLELTKQILIEKQQEQIHRYEKLRDHMTRIKPKGQSSPMMKTHFPCVKSKSTTQLINKQYQSDSLMHNSKMNDLLKSEINLSKISKLE